VSKDILESEEAKGLVGLIQILLPQLLEMVKFLDTFANIIFF
jgi:hypothetical protein